jgi:hypothetical protein
MAWAVAVGAAEIEGIQSQTVWRVWLTTAPRIAKEGTNQILVVAPQHNPPKTAPYTAATARLSSLPPADWRGRDFDDSLWGRYGQDLFESVGGYGCPVSDDMRAAFPALLCLRTRFGVSDPARATDVKVSVECLGGVVVYVNGEEVGRSHMPEGKIEAMTPADDYPAEVYTIEDGSAPLPALRMGMQPESRWLSRYEARVRRMTVPVPNRVLVKGANVLAVEAHRAAVCRLMPRGAWSHAGIRNVTVKSAAGTGLMAYAEALRGTRVWNAQAAEQVTEKIVPRNRIAGGWARGVLTLRGEPIAGIVAGNPFDPVLPVRILVPRNGVGHGQAVLSDPEGLRGVSAGVAGFQGPGAALPARAARVRFAVQDGGWHCCDTLVEKAPEGVTTLPVWLEVSASKDQAPGWYVSRLSLEANGKKFQVPVQVFVTASSVPDAGDLRSIIGVMHSPEAVANACQLKPWSDEHLAMMAKSLEMAGQLGGDILYVPVILGQHMGHQTGLIRWVKTDGGIKPDFRLFEKYLDLYQKYCAAPQAISLYVWSAESAKEVAVAYEGNQQMTAARNPKATVQVTQWDPATGETTNVTAPTFLDEGAEAFWKPMLDGVHAIVKKRGWPERAIMLGLASDSRPSQRTGELLRQWAPYARWDIYSHFSGDPGCRIFYKGARAKELEAGKLIAVGDLEVGMKEYPWGNDETWLQKLEFLDLPLQRAHFYDPSPALTHRTWPMHSGRLARVGLDFWPQDARYTVPIWGIYPVRMAGRGPEGPLPTVRFWMMRESVQEFEPRLTILESLSKLPADEQKPLRSLLNGLHHRIGTGCLYLSQMELSLDWPSYTAGVYEAAAELAGVKSGAKWEEPPK